jgi:predicted RNA binding protein YcfA (HicA-like mRNA interferase family)
MRQYTQKEFIRIVKKNGFHYDRYSGSHAIYVNDEGRHISIPHNLESVIARRLIKENNLDVNLRKNKMNNCDYPLGADTKDAPWNQEELPEREIEVTVSVTLSKTVKIKVSDYTITDSGKDEDGEYFEDADYSDCDLKGAVEEQIILPQNAWDYIAPKSKKEVQAIFDLKGWNVDEMEVILE